MLVTAFINSNSVSEDGELANESVVSAYCNVQMKQRQKFKRDKTALTIKGTAYFRGDICPEVSCISNGTVDINGIEYSIDEGQKVLNPDGTVNYTVLELI